jgi:benzoyl-CoA reductase subunit D
MIRAGIDVGTRFVKAVILQDRILSSTYLSTGFDISSSTCEAYDTVLREACLHTGDVEFIGLTGVGKKACGFKGHEISELKAVFRGAHFFCRNACTILEVGAEEARVVKGSNEKIANFAMNEKCAAGTGIFLETMSHALQVSFEEMDSLSLSSKNDISLDAQCVIFAESEVISLMHTRTPQEDIVKAIHVGMAKKIGSLALSVGVEKEIVLAGGVVLHRGFVKSLEAILSCECFVPANPLYVGAVGAALG